MLKKIVSQKLPKNKAQDVKECRVDMKVLRGKN